MGKIFDKYNLFHICMPLSKKLNFKKTKYSFSLKVKYPKEYFLKLNKLSWSLFQINLFPNKCITFKGSQFDKLFNASKHEYFYD